MAAVLAAYLRAAWLLRARAAARRRPHQCHCGRRRAAPRVLHALRLRAAVFPEPNRGRPACTGVARAMRKAFSRRRLRPPNVCARAARRVSASCSSPAKSGAATARWPPTGSRRNREFLINGEPTDNRLGAATRGVFRVRLVAEGRAAHSGYPELGESAIEKLLDVLVALRTARGRPTSCSGPRTTRSV